MTIAWTGNEKKKHAGKLRSTDVNRSAGWSSSGSATGRRRSYDSSMSSTSS
jgi:hypothetical protein